jgi:polysaccharide biosynthesis transport protein
LPEYPVSPNKPKVMVLAILVGLFMGGLLIFLIEHFKPSFSSAESVESTIGAPVLALVPRISGNGKGSLERQILIDPEKDENNEIKMYEVFNSMAINLFSSELWDNQKVLVVSSTFAKEGKSIIAANLAVMMAKTGKKVLLIDCDFRRPVQHTVFGVPNANGFADLITSNSPKGFVKTQYPNLIFLPAGNTGETVISELFHNPNMVDSINKLESRFDMIIIDSPPLLLYADAVVLSSHFKNVLLVIKSSTDEESVLKSKRILHKVNAKIVGTVINDVKKSLLFGNSYEGYEYGYGYGYGYGYTKGEE